MRHTTGRPLPAELEALDFEARYVLAFMPPALNGLRWRRDRDCASWELLTEAEYDAGDSAMEGWYLAEGEHCPVGVLARWTATRLGLPASEVLLDPDWHEVKPRRRRAVTAPLFRVRRAAR
jgi:hypothetical protein